MRPTFYGLEVAKTGLFISQKALDLTGHNIANVDTAGFTRQRLSLTAIDPYNASYKMKPLTRGLVGGGVQVQLLEQIRNVYLDRQFRTEQADFSRWSTRTTGLGYLEPLYDDYRGSGINSTITNLFNAFGDIEHTSSDQEQRKIMQQAAITYMASMKSTYDSMVTQHQVQNESVKGVADKINNIAQSIATLNEAIYRFENFDNQQANDLRDKRNLLLDQLSALVDMEYGEDNKGKMTVKIAGEVLVSHTTVNVIEATQVDNGISGETDLWQLSLVTQAPNPDYPAVPGAPPTIPVELTLLDNTTVSAGELKGHLELRDSTDKENNPGIPYFIEQLNILARAIVTEINAIHKTGYTHPNNPLGVSETGIDFFDVPIDPNTGLPNTNLINAGNMKLSAKVSESEWNIACSDEEIDLSAAPTAVAGNQRIALILSALIDSTSLPHGTSTGVSSFNGYILGMLADYTGTTSHSKTQTDTLNIKVLSVDNHRASISGVSLDEEMTNLIKFQHSYNGASRVITTLDEALEMLINRMGLVGRS